MLNPKRGCENEVGRGQLHERRRLREPMHVYTLVGVLYTTFVLNPYGPLTTPMWYHYEDTANTPVTTFFAVVDGRNSRKYRGQMHFNSVGVCFIANLAKVTKSRKSLRIRDSRRWKPKIISLGWSIIILRYVIPSRPISVKNAVFIFGGQKWVKKWHSEK